MRGKAIILGLGALLALAACNSGSPTGPADGGLQVVPETAAMTAGQSVQLTVTGSGGSKVTDGVVWHSPAPHVVSVSTSGLATAMYLDGMVSIRASVGTQSGEGTVTNLAACANPVALEGSAPPVPNGTQAFAVTLADGVDAAERAEELARLIGFTVTEVTENGFIATLNPQQTNTVRCVEDVVAMAFV